MNFHQLESYKFTSLPCDLRQEIIMVKSRTVGESRDTRTLGRYDCKGLKKWSKVQSVFNANHDKAYSQKLALHACMDSQRI